MRNDRSAVWALQLATLVFGMSAAEARNFEDFGDPNGRRILNLISSGGMGSKVHFVQIGDSHTAGDFFTDRLRVRLQEELGDGGLGWAMPMFANGQRLARIGYDQSGFQLASSRTKLDEDYPVGGLIAMGSGAAGELTIKSKDGRNPIQNVAMLINQGPYDPPLILSDADGKRLEINSDIVESHWSSRKFTARLPYTLRIQGSPTTRIGGWWLSNDRPGAIVSALGINGAELSHWSRWRPGWVQDLAVGKPDIVAIAYGTNEAFRDTLSTDQFRQNLETAVDHLRQQIPGVSVLIIGAPESLASLNGPCGRRPPSLDSVQAIQRSVALQRHTLYWDWQAAMGGACSMKGWVNRGWARKDGVHFSKDGYELAADDLFRGLNG